MAAVVVLVSSAIIGGAGLWLLEAHGALAWVFGL